MSLKFKQLAQTTQPGIITAHKTKLTTSKTPNYTPFRTDRVEKSGGALLTYIKHNRAFTDLNEHINIKTDNTKLQMIRIYTNKHKTSSCQPTRRSITSLCNIRHIHNKLHTTTQISILTGDVNPHSTLVLRHIYSSQTHTTHNL